MKAGQNSIQTAELNFNYSSKASAMRCNQLIESIFNSHILQDLENAVSTTIPGKVSVELSKLEIDIGSINENDLAKELPGRIASAMVKALSSTLSHEISSSSVGSMDNSKAIDYLIEALESYLSKGYFPSWVERAITVEDYVLMALHENKTGLLEMIFRCCAQDHAAKRLTHAVTTKLFDKLILAMLPVDGKWMLEYRKTLVELKKESGVPQISDGEYISTINFFILNEVIKSTAEHFNRAKFSDRNAEEIMRVYDLDIGLLLKVSKEITGTKSTITQLRKGLAKQRESVLTGKKDQFSDNASDEYATLYGHKVVGHFLIAGYLNVADHDLTRIDILRLFQGLLRQKDAFLLGLFRKYKNIDTLTQRLEALYNTNSFIEDDGQLPPELLIGNQKIQGYLKQLFSFTELRHTGSVNVNFWQSLVLRFALRCVIAQKKYTAPYFASSFMNFVYQQLGLINSEEMFSGILEKIKFSNSKELQELESLWEASDKNLRETKGIIYLDQNLYKEKEIARMEEKAHYYSSLIQFYEQKEFLPWWAEAQTISEALQQLKNERHVHPELAKETFDVLQRKMQGIKKADIIAESKSNKAIALNKVLDSAFQDSNMLFKSLYFLDDTEILGRWGKENPVGAKKLKEYLALAPHFYFRKLSPIRWRKIVYEFGLSYFGGTRTKTKVNFDKEFLAHLEKKYSKIEWRSVLSTINQITQKKGSIATKIFPDGLQNLIASEPDQSEERSDESSRDDNLIFEKTDTGGAKIFNAGMVLLWPFLTRFFEHISLLENEEFIDDKGKQRAVYLLQYLVYNSVDFQESDLVLNKVLVGVSPREHLSPFIKLGTEEKELTQSLLGGFIHNWDKMKASTTEAIQETFLQREGLLQFESDKFVLKVEKKGVDVLLTSIPWDISLIKIPWMQKPLYIEWV